MSLFHLPSSIQELKSEFLAKHGVSLFIKRDDLIHSEVSGNKWRKLKYNFEEIDKLGNKGVVTFGGAFSNHLVATAAAAQEYGFKSIGIVRGERSTNLSPTLEACERFGMQLEFITRKEYARKEEESFIKELTLRFKNFYIIPEGGANDLGCKGCEEILREQDKMFDYIAVSSGTGTTAAGILASIEKEQLICVSSLKGGDFLKENILQYDYNKEKESQFCLLTEYHFGGYAKVNQKLIDFVQQFYKEYTIKLDLVYTAKLFYALCDLISQQYFPRGSKILSIHTGGLQGNKGFESRKGIKLF